MNSDELIKRIELGDKVTEAVKEQTSNLLKTIAEQTQDIAWQIANDYINNHLEHDVVSNYRSAVRTELLEDASRWWRKPDDFWGQKMRATIYAENKEELLLLITNDEVIRLNKEVEQLRESLRFYKQLANNR